MIFYGKIYHVYNLKLSLNFIDYNGLIYLPDQLDLSESRSIDCILVNWKTISKQEVLNHIKHHSKSDDDIVIGKIRFLLAQNLSWFRPLITNGILIQNLSNNCINRNQDNQVLKSDNDNSNKSNCCFRNRCYRKRKMSKKSIQFNLIPAFFTDEYVIIFGNHEWYNSSK